ncbi:MAG: hypothetical protein ACP5T9_03175 [Thermoplasmata archaeon]
MDKNTKEKIDIIIDHIQNTFNTISFDTYYNNEKMWFVVKSNGRIIAGIRESWKSDPEIKSLIEEAFKVREEMIKEENLRNSWQVMVLSGDYTSPLYAKSLPGSLYRKLKESNDIYYLSEDDLEEMDMFTEAPGWRVTDAGKSLLKAEAERTATMEMREMVNKIKREQEQKDAQNKKEADLKDEMFRILEYLDQIERTASLAPEQPFPEGEEFYDPRYSWLRFSAFGGGRIYVIDRKKKNIFFITGNGADGDDWSRNNIKIRNGAGAIGFFVPYSVEIENKLKRLKELYTELNI